MFGEKFRDRQKPMVLVLGLGESGLAMARWCARHGCRLRIADTREVPPNLHSLNAGMMVQRQEEMRTQLEPDLIAFNNMLARVRQATHDYLVATESELDAGREESSFFDQVYVRINSLLTRYAPEAAKKFVAAEDRVSSGDAEDISHALTSCRRMIKSLADTLYSATG